MAKNKKLHISFTELSLRGRRILSQQPGYPTSGTVKKNFESQLLVEKEQAEFLIQYCNSHYLESYKLFYKAIQNRPTLGLQNPNELNPFEFAFSDVNAL